MSITCFTPAPSCPPPNSKQHLKQETPGFPRSGPQYPPWEGLHPYSGLRVLPLALGPGPAATPSRSRAGSGGCDSGSPGSCEVVPAGIHPLSGGCTVFQASLSDPTHHTQLPMGAPVLLIITLGELVPHLRPAYWVTTGKRRSLSSLPPPSASQQGGSWASVPRCPTLPDAPPTPNPPSAHGGSGCCSCFTHEETEAQRGGAEGPSRILGNGPGVG